jgi:hypothetical protein
MPHPYELARRRNSGDDSRFVRWSTEQKEQIAREGLAALAANPAISRLDALRAGIATLPREFQMRVNDFEKNRWVIPIWERLAAEHDARATQQAARAGAESLFEQAEQAEQTVTSEPEAAAVTTEGDDMAKKAAVKTVPAKKAGNASASARAKQGITKGMTLTRWKDHERMLVAKAFVRTKLDLPGVSDTEAIRKAMRDALPDDRQRTINGYSMEKDWLDKFIEQARHEVQLEREANQQTQAEREAEERERAEAERKSREDMERQRHELEERARREAEEHEKTVARVRESAIEDFLESCPIEDLIAAASRRLVSAFAVPFIEGLGNAIRDVKSTANPKFARFDLAGIDAAPRGINNRPKVYVVGLVREARTNLSKAFPNLDMAYGSNADEGGLSGEKCANADLVVLMTDYVAHSVRAKVKASAPNFVPLSGGLTSAKRCISQWLAGEANKLAA